MELQTRIVGAEARIERETEEGISMVVMQFYFPRLGSDYEDMSI